VKPNHRYQRLADLIAPKRISRLFKPDCLSIIPEMNLYDNIKLLDVGCNNARLIFSLATFLHDFEFHGLDIDPRVIHRNQARNRFPNVHFHCAPAENMPFENQYFDIVTCTNALDQFPQRVRALDEMHRLLKIGGEFYVLEGIRNRDRQWRNKFDKILRQSKFINPQRQILKRNALLRKSYFVRYIKEV